MASWNSPTVARRWLAFELRRLRDDSGLNQKDVANEFGWSGARLSYIENAQQNVADDDLAQLLPLYQVLDDRWPEFYEAAEAAREKGWWEKYPDHLVPPWLSRYVGLEQGASLIRTVEPYVVPGLLQTRDYVVANVRKDVVRRTDHQIDRIAELRMARQDIVVSEPPTELDVVIDESVLRRVVGGPEVMASQLEHLVLMAERPNVSLRVFPFESGSNTGMIGSYRILDFPGSQPSVVYMEHREGANFLSDVAEVDVHVLAFNHVVDSALPIDRSAAMVKELAAEYAARARE